jgi:mersacidin/lichenicidin family type 2 lantibiotic
MENQGLTVEQIVRAWQDPQYRNSLSSGERDALPVNPAGEILSENTEVENESAGLTHLSFCMCFTGE